MVRGYKYYIYIFIYFMEAIQIKVSMHRLFSILGQYVQPLGNIDIRQEVVYQCLNDGYNTEILSK